MTDLNASIRDIPIPERMRGLPISSQGYPIPWFVPYTRDGAPVPQAACPIKRLRAGRIGLCWCCGGSLGVHKAFAIGPMCMVNRVTSEPANHRECAQFAVRVCPFLRNPRMQRNPTVPEDGKALPPGLMIERNPGVVLVWITRHYHAFRDHDGGILYSLGAPESLSFFAEGRRATRAEIMESIESGIPILREMAEHDGKDALTQLEKQYAQALRLVPQD